jgi:transcriptional regulator with XRE-family HTH domain
MGKTENFQYNRIKAALAEKNKSNTELADAINVAVPTVSNWCTNSSQPSVIKLFAIAKFLNVTPGSLLTTNNPK